MAVKKAKKRKSTKQVILPSKMSSLIKIALRDIRKAEKLPKKYVVDMGVYFNPYAEIVCSVYGGDVVVDKYKTCVMCAAGSVMAFSLGKANSKQMLVPGSFPKNEKQLQAIDCLREGSVTGAAGQLGLIDWGVNSDKFTKLDVGIPGYDRADPEPFHDAMAKLQAKLAKAGL